MEQLHEIKTQIEWLRGWSNFGTADDRAWREGFIEYLQGLAQEIETKQARDVQRYAA